MSELQDTYDALKVILTDEETFNLVAHEVFASIDVNKDGSLELKEVTDWVNQTVRQSNIDDAPSESCIEEVF